MEHLIANSGIQFVTREVEFNPSEPLILPSGKALKYAFCETLDFLEGQLIFDFLYYHTVEGKYIPVDELRNTPDSLLLRPSGREELDETGMVMMDPAMPTTLFTTYTDADAEVITMNSLTKLRVPDPNTGRGQVEAFGLLLGKWLPMPMFRKEVDGVTSYGSIGWCRVKIEEIGEGSKKGMKRYRLIWAFDTQTSEDGLSVLRPAIFPEEGDSAEFTICNRADMLIDFMSSTGEFHAFSDYIAGLLNIDLEKEQSVKYKAYYIYLINFLRLSGASPDVMLHLSSRHNIPVDLVLDIGNSRTCGILFEEGDFTRAKMLELTNLTHPEEYYENKTYDMRVVFRKADFGSDMVLDEEMFRWRSFVRIGEEARRLVYRSLEEEGLAESTTNYSSPKRYIWDQKEFNGQWENLVTTDDAFNVRFSDDIYVPGMSELFNADGSYNNGEGGGLISLTESHHHYSRGSLMTFAYIEIFQHALSQINCVRYRQKWGNVDCRRYLRNIIITCPTALPLKEQVALRQQAIDAFDAIMRTTPGLKPAVITPSPNALKITDDYAEPGMRVWSYDEASCCQLTYLYAEIAERYSGEIHKFFEMKGHVRPELKEEGYEGKALTIGTIDIGAGTTDIMVCSYECEGEGRSRLSPRPLFWDSFYLAGDDILRNIVQNLVIEGENHGQRDQGNITGALTARVLEMTDDEMMALPCLDNVVYRTKASEIRNTIDPAYKSELKTKFAANLIHDFFGADSSMMGYRDRRCRTDFNTQISVPIAQMMLEMLRLHRPSKVYTFNDIFLEVKPADYLLDYFAHHFGFRFEELTWRFDPVKVADIVKATMEPLMKQLALVLYSQRCDIIVLAGRPTSLDAITELFIKYIPTDPARLIRLNTYHVGSWFPTADGQGNFYDQKSIVAAGAMVGYLSSHNGLKGLVIDFEKMICRMKSTANYIGEYNSRRQQVTTSSLTPEKSTATFNLAVFPAFLGCRQLDSAIYQARPLYAVYNNSGRAPLKVTVSRSYHDNREDIFLEDVSDAEGNSVARSQIEIREQSLVDDGGYWLDKGEFELTIK